MTDGAVRTEVRTDDGWLEFQEYFVHRHQAPDVHEVRFKGVEAAEATREVDRGDRGCRRASSSLRRTRSSRSAPILAVPGMRAAIDEARARGVRIVAVSPIVGGRALKGPADRMLRSLGHEASALGVARLYSDLVDVLVIDTADAALAAAVEDLGIAAIVTDTIMVDDEARARLAGEVLAAVG